MRLSYFALYLLLISFQTTAAISFVTSVTEDANDDKASLVVPSVVQAGDVLITQVVIRNRNGSDSVSFDSSWSLSLSQERDGQVLQSIYYKVATAADANTSYEWDFAGSGSRRYILGMSVYRGVDNVNPVAAENSLSDGAPWGSLTAPSVNTTSANSMLVALYAIDAGNQSFSVGAGMTEIYDEEEHNTNNGISAMAARELFPGVSATGTRNATASTSPVGGIGHLIALKEGATVPVITGITTNCAVINSLVVQFSKSLETASAENINNYSLINAASNPIAITAASLSTDSVTLTLASDMSDLTAYTLTVNNVDDLEGNTINANSSDGFALSCDLNCITDNFTGPGGLSDSWSVGNSSGTFGNPTIVSNGRLRLTDNSSDVSTVATLLNQFPGAENRIEIEFDYYGYAGSGADGIAVNFSDASIAPSAGAFGGSLGYAQKTGINGFSGGWLGVGIDEYGNFSTSGEGREGGGGSRIADSISLRGSGSGTSGYPFLTGTNSLSPGIDQSGNTPNPGHRYKIIIDHTSGGGVAMVSVQRDTGSGYSSVISEFNIFALNASQAPVPENWVVSFTGSTGGSSNIHEMGDLKICAAQPIQTFSIVDHYDLSHTSPGLTCEGSEVTITAHDINHAAINVLSDTSIDVMTTPAISGIVTSPVTMLTGTSSTRLYLQQTSELLNVDIDVTDGSFTDVEGSSEDPRLSFLDTAFRFYADASNTGVIPINTQISGKSSLVAPDNQSLVLRAIRTNTDTGACEAGLAGPQTVSFAYTCIDPDFCSATQLSVIANAPQNIVGTDAGDGLAYTGLDMIFDASGGAPFSFTFPDAGKIQLYANLLVPESSPNPAFTLTGRSNEFIVKPFAFDLNLDLEIPATGNYFAADASGSSFVSAGTAFPMTIRPVNWQSVDDANNDGVPDAGSDVSNNLVTLNFGQELSAQDFEITHVLNSPPSGASGMLSATAIKTSASEGFFTAGVTSPAVSLSWSEVGIIDIDVRLNNYLSVSGENILGYQSNVGRFYPDHFTLVSSDLIESCGTFSYMGQSEIEIVYKLQALNVAGTQTQYYDGAFVRMDPSLHINLVAENNNNGGAYENRLKGFDPIISSSNWVAGEYNYSEIGSFSRVASGVPDGPYRNLQIGIQLSDNDKGRTLNNLNMNAITNSNCSALANCDAERLDIIDDLDLRFGQLKLSNAFGPEVFSLDMPAQTEYYNGTAFVLNTDDNCTGLVATEPRFLPVALSWTDQLVAGETTPSLSSGITMTSGLAEFSFSAAGLGNEGSVIYQYDTNMYLPWLNTENDADADYADNPQGKITFGQFRGNDRMIYWREVVR
jgi:MSHA biogenesis protein MshQ